MVKLIVARLSLPIYSIKHQEAFQVMASLPIPQPSSLVGLLAYCMGVARGWGYTALERVKEWVREGKLLAARAALVEEALPLTVSSVVLRRFRIVDKAHEAKTSGVPKPIDSLREAAQEGDFKEAKSLLEIRLMDAFYREYVMGHELLCVWALADDVDVNPNWLYLAQRLGDTESLCSVLGVELVEGDIEEASDVRTRFPSPAEGIAIPISGPHALVKMCDEERQLRPYVIPCDIKVEKTEAGVVPVVRPSEVEITYEENVKIIKGPEGLLFTAFWPKERARRGR